MEITFVVLDEEDEIEKCKFCMHPMDGLIKGADRKSVV